MEGTNLIFRTKPGAVTIPANSSTSLTKDLPTTGLIVKAYPAIRLVCSSRVSSTSPMTIKLIFLEGRELISTLATIVLSPGENFTTIYPIPGTALSITATSGDGDTFLDLFVYGYSPEDKYHCPHDPLCC